MCVCVYVCACVYTCNYVCACVYTCMCVCACVGVWATSAVGVNTVITADYTHTHTLEPVHIFKTSI